VILTPFLIVQHHAVEYSQQLRRADYKAGLFQGFPFRALTHGFAKLQHSAGDGPLAEQRRLSALDQRHPASIHDNGAHSNQRAVGILSWDREIG
jgi:hypothetical protein